MTESATVRARPAGSDRTAATWDRVHGAGASLSTQAVQRMAQLPWFGTLSAQQRADVGLVVQTGIAAFVAWLRDPVAAPVPAPEVFSVAPVELARSVTLKQTVQLIRVVVGVIEEQVPTLAAEGDEARLAEQVLRYSREVAFAAAEVYAAAAEARGAWDARVEAGVVEALVRGDVGEVTLARASSLGWGPCEWVTALAASAPGDAPPLGAGHARNEAHHRGWSVLTGEAGGGLLVVVGGPAGQGGPATAVTVLADALPSGPVVTGPVVAELAAAAGAVREALAGMAAVAGWPQAPRPVASSALLAERAVLGDDTARRRLVEEVHSPLAAAGGDLLGTAAAYLDGGSSVEGCGRLLFLHPNTVRYRLRKIVTLIGYDLTRPRDAQVVRLALVLGRLRCADAALVGIPQRTRRFSVCVVVA